ncbi:MAG: hypothetical protein IPO92_00920 [Saprospiraceae bacterium]|nr:hypothetical protein [Saprospiraceae bacterium]
MKKYVRSFAYVVVMGLFLNLGLSCVGSGNAEEIECNLFEDPIIKTQEVFIKVINRVSNKPIPNAPIFYVITYGKMYRAPEGPNCYLDEVYFELENKTGSEGIFYIPIDRVYNSSDEYTIISLRVSVQGYNKENVEIRLNPNDNGKRKDVYLLPVELYQ